MDRVNGRLVGAASWLLGVVIAIGVIILGAIMSGFLAVLRTILLVIGFVGLLVCGGMVVYNMQRRKQERPRVVQEIINRHKMTTFAAVPVVIRASPLGAYIAIEIPYSVSTIPPPLLQQPYFQPLYPAPFYPPPQQPYPQHPTYPLIQHPPFAQPMHPAYANTNIGQYANPTAYSPPLAGMDSPVLSPPRIEVIGKEPTEIK